MRKHGLRNIRFKLALVTGSLLGVLVLAVSVVTYFEVNRSLVTTELRREVQRQLTGLQREAGRLGIQDPADLGAVLDEMLREAPHKVAWVQVFDDSGKLFSQSGKVTGPPFSRDRLREVAGGGTPAADLRETDYGKVLAVVHYVRLTARPPEPGSRDRSLASRQFVEIAVYWDSASEEFVGLRADLILSCAAALGLVLSMLLLWSRFPHYIRGKQLEQETELARQVQADLLPPAGDRFAHLEFAAKCVPAEQVGGDFYDIYSIPDGGTAIVLGDVSGHGLSASVVMGLLLGAIRASSWVAGPEDHQTSSRRLSDLLRTRTSTERFASLFWCYYQPATRLLRYINAGHPTPFLVRRNGNGKIEIHRLDEGGPVLGIIPAAEYRQGEVALCGGDILVFYTDGVIEAATSSEEQFGEERLLDAIRDNAQRSMDELRDEILQRIHGFVGEVPPGDDLTLVVIRIENANAQASVTFSS